MRQWRVQHHQARDNSIACAHQRHRRGWRWLHLRGMIGVIDGIRRHCHRYARMLRHRGGRHAHCCHHRAARNARRRAPYAALRAALRRAYRGVVARRWREHS